ncbi:MAG: TonB-dependent receptor [Prolixibacteraceae bacterium]|nr:TonB-dependent receptor [Prolixibacteraceae bacterium]
MKNLIILAALLMAQLAVAQNKISGKILDEQNLPLAGAQIFAPELNKGTIADELGRFELNHLPSGEIKVQFSFLGYNNQIETFELKGLPISFNAILKETSLEAEEIVVSGGYNSTQHDNAVKIEVLPINSASVKNTPNFAEILTKVPGVDMISKGNGVSKPVIRGLSMNDILVLNNGVRFENYQYSSHHPLGIDEFGIEDVEIIKGPASLLYGSDAIGGVVNFIKEKPASIGAVSGDYNLQMFSNSQGITNNLGVKGASKKWFGGFRAGQKSNADYLEGGGRFVPNSRFNEWSVKTNVGFTDAIGTFKLFYDYNSQKLGLVEDEAVEAITERGRHPEILFQKLNTHLLSSQNKLFLGRYKLDLNAAFQNTELAHLEDPETYEIQMNLVTFTYEAKIHLPSGPASEYILGIQGFKQENSNLNEREVILLPDAQTNNFSVFGLFQKTFFSKLKVQSGLRFDSKNISSDAVGTNSNQEAYRPAIDKSYESFSGSFGATFHATEELLFRANLAAAYRTPNLAELTSNGPHELRFEVGDRNLSPENALEADLSLHYHNDQITFDVAGFYNAIDNYIFIAPTGDQTSSGMGIFQYRQANSALWGGEAGLHIHPEAVKWLHCETTFSMVTGKQKSGDFLPFVPAPKWRVELRAEKEKIGILTDAYALVSSLTALNQNNPAPDETPTSGYFLVDLNLGGKLNLFEQPLQLSFGLNNLFDVRYIDHLSTLKEVNYFNPGRNLTLTLRLPFGWKNE